MLGLLRASPIDPISYSGLAYCRHDYCGRVGCSEACWFGSLRRRRNEKNELGRLLRERSGKLWEAVILRTKWDRRYGDLHEIDSGAGTRLVGRVLNSFTDRRIVAVGTFKVRPFGYNNHGIWRCEIHLIVGGLKPFELETSFHEKPRQVLNDVWVTPVKHRDAAVAKVLDCNEPAEPVDLNYDGQRGEFYVWLATMKVGSRLIRYGCD
jgi:hypothetical protein